MLKYQGKEKNLGTFVHAGCPRGHNKKGERTLVLGVTEKRNRRGLGLVDCSMEGNDGIGAMLQCPEAACCSFGLQRGKTAPHPVGKGRRAA